MSLSILWRIKRWLLRKITRDIYAAHINESTGFIVLYKGPGSKGVAVGIQVRDITAHKEGERHRQVFFQAGEKPPKPWPIEIKPSFTPFPEDPERVMTYACVHCDFAGTIDAKKPYCPSCGKSNNLSPETYEIIKKSKEES